jgi:hypothetical protein
MENNIMQLLQKPFMPNELEWRVGATTKDKTKGIALVYVTNRAIQNRLDKVFGCFSWKNEFRIWKNGQLCGISVKNENEWITKWDGADDTEFESLKGGLSDSMKRAAYQWGIGRYLYSLPTKWVKIKQVGKSYKIDMTKEQLEKLIPTEFLPNEYKITQEHIKKIMTLAHSCNFTDDDIKKWIKIKFSKKSKKDLNLIEYETLVNELSKHKKEAV